MQMRLELIPLPSTDVDGTKAFYVDQVGFILDHDIQPGNGMRVGATHSTGIGVLDRHRCGHQ